MRKMNKFVNVKNLSKLKFKKGTANAGCGCVCVPEDVDCTCEAVDKPRNFSQGLFTFTTMKKASRYRFK